jgi:hypothetical protein
MTDHNDDLRFDRLESHVERMALVQKAAEEHTKTLKERHPGLVMVTGGFRHRRDEIGNYALHPEPCVLLTVRNKWPSDRQGSVHEQPLPSRLYVNEHRDGTNIRYGVPTDVQDMKWLEDVTPQGASQIVLNTKGNPRGALTCGVDVVTAAGTQRFALSALHVLSPMPDVDAPPRQGAQFAQLGGPPVAIGISTPFGGALLSHSLSLDAQLASINPTALKAAFGNLPHGRVAFAQSQAQVDAIAHTSKFVIAVPTNVPWPGGAPRPPVYSQFSGYANASFAIGYNVTHNGVTFPQKFNFAELIVVAAGAGNPVTLPGDSGSPVIAVAGGAALLVGMLIAGPAVGSGADKMIILPSWLLFNPANWVNPPPGIQAFLPTF